MKGLKERAERIRSMAEKRGDETADLLSQLVRIPSPSGDEGAVVSRIRTLLLESGFDEVRVDGLGSVIGRIGNGKRVLAFDAHIDTVETGDTDAWEFDPFCGDVRDGFVLGRGSVDQKGGAAAMIAAGRVLKELGYEGPFTLLFTFTVMEEDCDGLCWNYLIEEEGVMPDYALITEPTNLAVTRGHRGRMEIELLFKGVSAHGSAPERGDNAVYKACRAALGVEELNGRLEGDDFLGKGSVAVTRVESSSPSLCAVPDGCMMHLDRRLTSGETRDSALQEARVVAGPEAEIFIPVYKTKSYRGKVFPMEKYYPTWVMEEDHPLVRAGTGTAGLLFRKDKPAGRWVFSTNGVALCGKHGVPCLGFGPGNEALAHAPNERVPVSDLVTASAFYGLFPSVLEHTLEGEE